jgi:hypothetical protein
MIDRERYDRQIEKGMIDREGDERQGFGRKSNSS